VGVESVEPGWVGGGQVYITTRVKKELVTSRVIAGSTRRIYEPGAVGRCVPRIVGLRLC
jgi:hypothetical protein